MTVYGESPTGVLRAVAAHMASEFGGQPPTLVVVVVRDAERDLVGRSCPAPSARCCTAWRWSACRSSRATGAGTGRRHGV